MEDVVCWYGPVQYTCLSDMGRGTVDQWKMWFAGMDLSSTRVFLSHMGRGTVDQCQWKMWFAGDGPIPYGEGPFLYRHLSESR